MARNSQDEFSFRLASPVARLSLASPVARGAKGGGGGGRQNQNTWGAAAASSLSYEPRLCGLPFTHSRAFHRPLAADFNAGGASGARRGRYSRSFGRGRIAGGHSRGQIAPPSSGGRAR